jgi:phosphoribosylglycinamide formyltransferase-1
LFLKTLSNSNVISVIIPFFVVLIIITMKKIVLFASGTGSNVEKIIEFFRLDSSIKVSAVFCNNPDAEVLKRAIANHIPVVIFSKDDLKSGLVTKKVSTFSPSLIVLAGFLLHLPLHFVESFAGKIINIHPALLPKHGGKGMYGKYVHQAVLDHGDKETGITIHYVNEHYDKGEVIFQMAVAIDDCKDADEISKRVQKLEHDFLPRIIEQILK